MTFGQLLESLMSSTMALSTVTGMSTDGYQVATYTTSASWPCRITNTPALIHSQTGDEQMARTIMWVASTSTWSPYDKITVGGSTLGPVLRVAHFNDQVGHSHSKVWFG